MAEDDPLNVTENVLRDLISDVLGVQHGDTWQDHLGVTAERRAKWEERRTEERKRRTGGVVDERSLYYADFTDLWTIIGNEKNWALFKDCFGKKKTLEAYLDRLGDFRNPSAHSRSLLTFERDLINGMTGEIRQKVTIYRSKGGGGPEPEHFPRIDEVRDSYGHTTAGAHALPGGYFVRTGLTLRPGDSVVFSGAATDPDDRALHWQAVMPGVGTVMGADGNTFEWTWTIDESHIAVDRDMHFWLASDRPYHRGPGPHDDFAIFRYQVLPRSRG